MSINSKLLNGQAMILSIVFLAVILIISAALFARVAGFVRFGTRSILQEQAVNLAEAGVDFAIWQLNETAGAYTGGINIPVGTTGTFTITITPKTANLITITSTGYVPNTISPRAKKTIKVNAYISTVNIAFRYAVQIGIGGVAMENSATINGTVYSNANITGSGSSTINGDAYAVGTISSPDPLVTGTKNPNSPLSQMPSVDYQYWKDQATAGGVTTCAPECVFGGGFHNLGPQKYVGNLTLDNSAQATMNGPIYVTGTVGIKNSASLKLNDSFGSTGTVLIADGQVTVQNGGGVLPTNADPKGYILVVTTSQDSGKAVDIKNQGVNAIFYALEGGATIQGTAQVTALVAKSLVIKNSATLDYDSGLTSAQFTSGPGGSWQVKRGSYKFTTSP